MYDRTGTPAIAGEFQVNSYTYGNQQLPRVASAPDGRSIVVWESVSQDGSGVGVYGQRLLGGTPLGPEFRVNTFTSGHQRTPVVSSDALGNFVVVWTSSPEYGLASDILAQRYDNSGSPIGTEFRVNSYTGRHESPAVALDPTGRAVIVWTTVRPGGAPGTRVIGQRFSPIGERVGAEFQVNDSTSGALASVATDANGNFMVVWTSWLAPDNPNVFGRQYDNLGAPSTGEFRVNSYTTGQQEYAVVSSEPDGDFIAAWHSYEEDGSDRGVFAQRYTRAVLRDGAEFQVNTYTTNRQRWPSVASDATGQFVVTWTSLDQDGDAYGVFAQRFAPDLIFRDDFESGDLSAWSDGHTDAGDLATAAGAAMEFTRAGLQGTVNDTAALYVQDDRPESENRYRLDDNSQANTAFFPIADSPHAIEIDLTRASGPDANDGTFEMWIDGDSKIMLTGLDNSLGEVAFIRLGALCVKSGANGGLYWDEFESRRASYIGP